MYCTATVSLPKPPSYYGMSCCLCMALPLPQLNMAQPYLNLYCVSLVFTTVAPAVSTTTVVYNYRGVLAVKFFYRDRAIVPAVTLTVSHQVFYVRYGYRSKSGDLCYVLLPWYSRSPNCYALLPWAITFSHHVMLRLAHGLCFNCYVIIPWHRSSDNGHGLLPWHGVAAPLLSTVTWHTGLFPFVLYCYRDTQP